MFIIPNILENSLSSIKSDFIIISNIMLSNGTTHIECEIHYCKDQIPVLNKKLSCSILGIVLIEKCVMAKQRRT